ncbi:putative F-box/kelch-repeat protein At1g20790 [Lycium ferocissimum]|uniref:putative F-box/kelch-repeat protein At1g20790 n=1 Tax=Lycium ferocissimum TaxID=112874 RepID=UPI00281541AF|nr:putative F-box/kelch-repeat protein At1g20790 [Lycium ferocissimum]
MERAKGMRNGNRAEESNSITVSKGLQDDLIVGEIVSRLPLKFSVQCKVVSKNFSRCISDPKFSQTLLQREMDCSTKLIYTSNGSMRKFHKISLNHIPTTQCKTSLPDDVEVLASCKGLVLLDFEEIKVYCIFNPITGAHQLITYPETTTFMMIGYPGLAVDYSSSAQYTLVTICKLAKNFNPFYKFHVLSSEQSGLWREFQLRSNTFSDLAVGSPPVYWLNSLYWLRSDGSVIAYDIKREEAIILDSPELSDHSDSGKILTGRDIWLGVAQGLLTLVRIFEKSIVIAAYDYSSSNWIVSPPLENFVSGPDGIINGFPVLIDSKRVFFVVEHPLAMYDLYEYDTEISGYKKASVLSIIIPPLYSFQPTLARVHETPSEIVNTHHLSYIAAKFDVFRRFITEGIS